jgi:hypothetical protein
VGEESVAEACPGAPVAKLNRVDRAPELGGRLCVAQVVPEDKAQDLAFSGPEPDHCRVHLRPQDLEAVRRGGRLFRAFCQALVEPVPSDGRATVVGYQAPSDAEEPEPVFRRSGHHIEAPPGDGEDLGYDVAGVVLAHTPANVNGDCLALGGVESLETARAAHVEIALWHLAGLRSLSLTQLYGRDNH